MDVIGASSEGFAAEPSDLPVGIARKATLDAHFSMTTNPILTSVTPRS